MENFHINYFKTTFENNHQPDHLARLVSLYENLDYSLGFSLSSATQTCFALMILTAVSERLYAMLPTRISIDKHMNSALEKVSRELCFERPITFHQARHSFAVMAINKGVRIEVLSKLLGHSSIISTEKTYARFLRSTIDDEIRKVMEW